MTDKKDEKKVTKPVSPVVPKNPIMQKNMMKPSRTAFKPPAIRKTTMRSK